MLWFLAVITTVYLLHAAWTDLKERYVYGNVGILLALAWLLYYLVQEGWNIKIFCVLAVHIFLWVAMNYFHIWGNGDSDLLLVFAMVNAWMMASYNFADCIIIECIFLIAAMLLSVLASVLEMMVRKKKWSIWTRAAVAPGFAIVTIYMLSAILVAEG